MAALPPQTGAQKVLARASGRAWVQPGDIVTPVPELVIVHDGYVESAYNELHGLGYRRIVHPERVVFVTDHEVAYSTPAGALRGRRNRRIAQEWDVGQFFDAGRGGHGHIFPLERGMVRPGMFLACYDMHCTNFGSVGAVAASVGSEVVTVLARGAVWEMVPHTLRVAVHGALPRGVMARDVGYLLAALAGSGRLGAEHDNRIVEFAGETVDQLPLAGRVALCNSLTEMGVSNIWFDPPPGADAATAVRSDADAPYEAVVDIDVGTLAPQVALPGGPERGVAVGEVERVRIDHAFIGACGSGMYEDFVQAASVLRQRSVAPHVRLFAVPGTPETAQRLAREGILDVFQQAGAIVLPSGCGPCAGGSMGPMADGEVSISTAATNHAGRFGSTKADAYLASPLTVAASAVAGHISDPREWL